MTDDARSYALPAQSVPTLDPSHHLQDLVQIRALLKSRGISTTNTRIERYHNYFEKIRHEDTAPLDAETIFKNSADPCFRIPADWHMYVLREVHELMWILKGLEAHTPIGVDEKLRAIVSGSDFAALDADSQSRNTQFELRIASYFCQAGFTVDLSTDTDVIASTDQFVFFVECKRVASASKLAARLSEARKQLGQRMPRKDGKRIVLGCVAVDVTKVGFTHNGLTFGVTPDHSRDVIRDKLVQIATQADRYMSFEGCRKLLCYWLQIHIPTLVMQPQPNVFGTRFSSYHIPRPSLNRKEAKALTAFFSMFESVSQVDGRASPSRPLTPRNSVTLPAGTVFRFDSSRVLTLLGQTTVSENEQAEVVGEITIEGIEHKFTYYEVSLLPADLIQEWKHAMPIDPMKASLPIMASLYLRRYPYEEREA